MLERAGFILLFVYLFQLISNYWQSDPEFRSCISFRREQLSYLHSDLGRFTVKINSQIPTSRLQSSEFEWTSHFDVLVSAYLIFSSVYRLLAFVLRVFEWLTRGPQAPNSRKKIELRARLSCSKTHVNIYSWIIYSTLCYFIVLWWGKWWAIHPTACCYICHSATRGIVVRIEWIFKTQSEVKNFGRDRPRDLAERIVKLTIVCRVKRGNSLSKKNWSKILNF